MGVQPPGPPDSFYLEAASGWLGLGCAQDAREELARIAPEFQEHPAVLEVRWTLSAHEKKWAEALAIADREMVADLTSPAGWLHRAYALRRAPAGGLRPAREALLPAAEMFPEEPVIPYNLACYACQLERLEEARVWLRQAMRIGEKKAIQQMALADEDLKPLWPEVIEL